LSCPSEDDTACFSMGLLQRRHCGVTVSKHDQYESYSPTFGKYIFFQHLSHNTPLPFSTRIHLASSMSLEHRKHVKTDSRCLASPLALDSWDSLSFLEISGEPPPIAPEIVPPRRTMFPATVDDSRCGTDVKERIGSFGVRVNDKVEESGDNGVSVDVGDRKSAARTVSRLCDVGVRRDCD